MLKGRCLRCGKIKPITSKYFYRNKNKLLGFDKECKKCSKKRRNNRRQKPRHKEKERKWNKQWREKNLERYKKSYQEYYRKNKKQILEKQRKRYNKNHLYYRKLHQKSKLRHGNGLLSLRFRILKRDNFTCQYCGRKAPNVILQVDHIIPRSKGGKLFDETNLITSCFDCNLGKKDILLNLKDETFAKNVGG